jgi:hypothetical protein
LGVPSAPRTVQYRGEGGPGYIDTAMGYTTLLVNFTRMARTNPDLTLDEVLTKLRGECATKPDAHKAKDSGPVNSGPSA